MTAIETWRDEFTRALQTLRRPADFLTVPDPGPADAERLEALITARRALGVDAHDLHAASPTHAAGITLAAVIANDRERLAETIGRAAAGVDAAIVACIEKLTAAEVHRAGLIRTGDFGTGVVIVGAPPLCFGLLNLLPADHPLMDALPTDAAYRL